MFICDECDAKCKLALLRNPYWSTHLRNAYFLVCASFLKRHTGTTNLLDI